MRDVIQNTKQIIGAASVVVLREVTKGQRKVVALINVSTGGQNITLSWVNQAQALEGITLFPGGSWSESVDNVFVPSNEIIYGIASAAGAVLSKHVRIGRE